MSAGPWITFRRSELLGPTEALNPLAARAERLNRTARKIARVLDEDQVVLSDLDDILDILRGQLYLKTEK